MTWPCELWCSQACRLLVSSCLARQYPPPPHPCYGRPHLLLPSFPSSGPACEAAGRVAGLSGGRDRLPVVGGRKSHSCPLAWPLVPQLGGRGIRGGCWGGDRFPGSPFLPQEGRESLHCREGQTEGLGAETRGRIRRGLTGVRDFIGESSPTAGGRGRPELLVSAGAGGCPERRGCRCRCHRGSVGGGHVEGAVVRAGAE